MKRLKCLFLDWHNTLSTSLFWDHLNNPSHHMLESITSFLFKDPIRFSTVLEPWMRGERTSEEIIHLLCQETAFDPSIVFYELMVSCQQMQFVSQDIPHYISSIRAKGIKVVIATDNMDTFLRWTVPRLHLYHLFDDILCSSDVKGLKSDIKPDETSTFFAQFLQKHHIGRGESLLLDDGNEEFGNVIRRFGIEYQQVSPGVGLVPALQTFLSSM